MAYKHRAVLAWESHLWQDGQQGAPSSMKDPNNSFAPTSTSEIFHVTEHRQGAVRLAIVHHFLTHQRFGTLMATAAVAKYLYSTRPLDSGDNVKILLSIEINLIYS